jgi:hypothetical protein
MSNNIYNILNNFNKVAQEPVTPATQTQSKAKTQLQESMDQVLSEKYMGFKKTVAAVKKGGADNPEAVAASIGRKKYGKEKFQKAAAAGKKLGEQTDYVQSTSTGFSATAPKGKKLSVTLEPGKKLTPSDVKLKADSDSEEKKKEQDMSEAKETYTINGKKVTKQAYDAEMKKAGKKVSEASKPDYIDLDKDGNKTEPMKKAAKDKKLRKKNLNELSPELLTRYKQKATDQSRHARELAKGTSVSQYQDAQRGEEVYDNPAQATALAKKREAGVEIADYKLGKRWTNDPNKPRQAAISKRVDAKRTATAEVAPPGAKAERMVKHIKKGYAKDGKLTDVEKRKAYGAAWKAHNKGKLEETIRSMMEAGYTKEQIIEGWDDMLKAVKDRAHGMKTGEKRSGAKGEIEKTATGIRHTRRYDPKTGETGDGTSEPVKRGRGRPRKHAFESSSAARRLISDTFADLFEGSIQGGVWTSDPPKKGQPNVPVPQNIDGGSVSPASKASKAPQTPMPKASEPAMGTIKGGVWTSDPPKAGEKGVPVPVPVDEADMEEGNYFGNQVRLAKEKGLKKADLDGDGDMETVREGEQKCNECGMWESKCKCDDKVSESLNLFRRLAGLQECGMSPIGGYAQEMQDSQGKMNISTNMSTDGNKSVTITADGDSALELMQMLKLAGMGGGEMSQEQPEGVMVVSTDDDEELNERMPLPKIGADGQPDPADMQKLQQAIASKEKMSQELSKQSAGNSAKPEPSNSTTPTPSEVPTSGIQQKSADIPEEQEVDEAKDERYHANTTPEEHVMPVQAQTKGGDGDVAGKEKKMTPHGYQFGDNPQAMKESMSLKLIKEYEDIKVKK